MLRMLQRRKKKARKVNDWEDADEGDDDEDAEDTDLTSTESKDEQVPSTQKSTAQANVCKSKEKEPVNSTTNASCEASFSRNVSNPGDILPPYAQYGRHVLPLTIPLKGPDVPSRVFTLEEAVKYSLKLVRYFRAAQTCATFCLDQLEAYKRDWPELADSQIARVHAFKY